MVVFLNQLQSSGLTKDKIQIDHNVKIVQSLQSARKGLRDHFQDFGDIQKIEIKKTVAMVTYGVDNLLDRSLLI